MGISALQHADPSPEDQEQTGAASKRKVHGLRFAVTMQDTLPETFLVFFSLSQHMLLF
jgi:hypothetical protein